MLRIAKRAWRSVQSKPNEALLTHSRAELETMREQMRAAADRAVAAATKNGAKMHPRVAAIKNGHGSKLLSS